MVRMFGLKVNDRCHGGAMVWDVLNRPVESVSCRMPALYSPRTMPARIIGGRLSPIVDCDAACPIAPSLPRDPMSPNDHGGALDCKGHVNALNDLCLIG